MATKGKSLILILRIFGPRLKLRNTSVLPEPYNATCSLISNFSAIDNFVLYDLQSPACFEQFLNRMKLEKISNLASLHKTQKHSNFHLILLKCDRSFKIFKKMKTKYTGN